MAMFWMHRSFWRYNVADGQGDNVMKKIIGRLAILILGMFFFLGTPINLQASEILYCPDEYIEICDEMQEKYGVSSSLLIAMIQCESSCIPDVVSSEGAVGLMQVMPCNNPDGLDLTNPKNNIELGTKVLLAWKNEAGNEDLLLVLSLYEGWGNTAYKRYDQELWTHKCFDYAHKVLDLAHEIDEVRYGR